MKVNNQRERRKVYESAVAAILRIQNVMELCNDKKVIKQADKQMDDLGKIIYVALGYHEGKRADGMVALVPEDENNEFVLDKDKFKDIITQLPNDKKMKEALWKGCIKRCPQSWAMIV